MSRHAAVVHTINLDDDRAVNVWQRRRWLLRTRYHVACTACRWRSAPGLRYPFARTVAAVHADGHRQ